MSLALASGSGGSIISPDGSLVVVFILFLIFVFVLNHVLFKPIGRVLDERKRLTTGSRDEAHRLLGDYRSRLDEYETGIRQARGESYRFLEQQRLTSLEARRATIEEAKKQTTDKIAAASSEIAEQAKAAHASLGQEATQIAARISSTLLGRSVGGVK